MKEENIWSIRFKVGIFTILGILLIGAISVYVNDRPFWWRPCQLIHIHVPDATGLKTKSPIRSLGLQIGFLKYVQLYEENVKLAICLTAPVQVLPETRAYIRGEGFLGDKFVELKPVRYIGDRNESGIVEQPAAQVTPGPTREERREIRRRERHQQSDAPRESKDQSRLSLPLPPLLFAMGWVQYARGQTTSKEVPVEKSGQDIGHLVEQVDGLVDELKDITKTLNYAIKPEELRDTLRKLNVTLEHAQKALSPEGGMTSTAQRTLAKLEDAIEQMRDQMTRINQGKGSVGMLLNDPSYAEELREALRNINTMLGKVSGLRIQVTLLTEYIPAYSGTRAGALIGIWPQEDRYYLLGASVDPRGKTTTKTITVTSGTSTTSSKVVEEESGAILITGMLGKVLWKRLDLSAGFLHGDGAIAVGWNLGSEGTEDRLQLITQGYASTSSSTTKVDGRVLLRWFPSNSPYLSTIYIDGGLDSIRKVNGKVAYSFGAGLSFDDKDIKMLFSFL